MTRERALHWAREMDAEFSYERNEQADVILKAVAEAVAEEREACALIAEANGGCELHHCDEIVAAEIRDRGNSARKGAT